MKSHAESLSPTLSTLASSFDNMSRLEAQLRSALVPVYPPAPPNNNVISGPETLDVQRDLVPIVTLPTRLRDLIALGEEEQGGGGAGSSNNNNAGESAYLSSFTSLTGLSSNLIPLCPFSTLPLLTGLAAAEALWGRHEAVLSSWIAQGVPGAEGVASECRAVLREQREKSRRRASVGAGASSRRI